MINSNTNPTCPLTLYLSQSEVFEKSPKAISCAIVFLKRIATLQNFSEHVGCMVQFYSKTISKVFQTVKTYRQFVIELEKIGLLLIDHDYVFPEEAMQRKTDSYCKGYFVTDLGIRLLAESNTIKLCKTMKDKVTKRQNQKAASKRKNRFKSYSDYVLDYHRDLITNMDILDEEVEQYIGGMVLPSNKFSATSHFLKFKEKNFNEFSRCTTDNRLHNEFNLMRKSDRCFVSYKQLRYRRNIDIRSCILTFFGDYIYNLLKPRDVTDSITGEWNKWNKWVTDPTDPRQSISTDLGLKMEHVKAACNSILNGSSQYPEVLDWLDKEYPELMAIWKNTDVKTTGNNIICKYETRLIQSPAIYRIADTMGIKLVDERDGYGVFALPDESDESLDKKCKLIADWLKSKSGELFGLPIVSKIKPTDDVEKIISEIRDREMAQMEDKYNKLLAKKDFIRRKAGATGNWTEYHRIELVEKEQLKDMIPIATYFDKLLNPQNN